MKQIVATMLLGGLLFGCGNTFGELFGRTPDVGLTVYRLPQGTREGDALLTAEAKFNANASRDKFACVRFFAKQGFVGPARTGSTEPPTAHESFVSLSSSSPYRAVVLYRPSLTATSDVILAELFPSAACSGKTDLLPTAQAVLSIDYTASQTTNSSSSQDMSIADLGQVRD